MVWYTNTQARIILYPLNRTIYSFLFFVLLILVEKKNSKRHAIARPMISAKDKITLAWNIGTMRLIKRSANHASECMNGTIKMGVRLAAKSPRPERTKSTIMQIVIAKMDTLSTSALTPFKKSVIILHYVVWFVQLNLCEYFTKAAIQFYLCNKYPPFVSCISHLCEYNI